MKVETKGDAGTLVTMSRTTLANGTGRIPRLLRNKRVESNVAISQQRPASFFAGGWVGPVLLSMRKLATTILFASLLCGVCAAGDVRTPSDARLDRAFRQMYNLDFAGAEVELAAHNREHPQDPLGEAAEGARLLFGEFERLQVLHYEFFADDDAYKRRKPQQPDPEVKRKLDAVLANAESLAAHQIAANPHDKNALFAMNLVYGLRADYAALIERRDWAALNYTKAAKEWADKLLAIAPDYYDAYLGAGIGKYLVSLKPAPVRWFLRLGGVSGNREEGLRDLRITAERGRFLAPFARLLIAIDHLRSGRRDEAIRVLSQLHNDFPNNSLFAQEMARLEAHEAAPGTH